MKYALILAVFLPWTPIHAMIPLEMGFSELPIELQFIAICESGGRPNAIGPYGEVGLLQIHPKYHAITSKKLGFNIYEPRGNMAYGFYLYKVNGLKDWSPSKSCWQKMLNNLQLALNFNGISHPEG